MKPAHAVAAAFAVGLAVAFGSSALMRTVQLGISARRQSARDLERTIAARTLALDRQQATLRAALRKRPPALPPIPHVPANAAPAAQPLAVAAPAPAPTVVLTRQAPVTRTHSSPAHHGDGEGGDD
jgi:hypothetical protein